MIYNYNGKIVGNLHKGTFYKSVDSRKHFMKLLNSYAIQKSIYDDLKKNGLEKVEVFETNKKKRHLSTVEDWETYGVVQDFGGGLQIFLPLKRFSLSNGQLKLIK